MGESSAIEWTEATLNMWTGCTKVSPGCANCYIERTPPFRTAGRQFVKGHIPLEFHMERLEKMLRRRKPTMYFVNSLSDVFHEDVPDEYIARLFAAMAAAPQHTFQVLTKRPERMQALLSDVAFTGMVALGTGLNTLIPLVWPLPNAWMGVSIENRKFVTRADLLRETPAAVRFISAEPLLGPLVEWMVCSTCSQEGPDPRCEECAGAESWPLEGGLDLGDIDWLIAGGESGPEHRRMDLQWVRDLRDLAELYGTAFFFKQLGGYRPGSALEELPEDLRIRQMPQVLERSHVG